MPGRSLYQCLNAKVHGGIIYCAKGHRLGSQGNGTINILGLARGMPLVFKVCQQCADYDEMGFPVERHDRGWASQRR